MIICYSTVQVFRKLSEVADVGLHVSVVV